MDGQGSGSRSLALSSCSHPDWNEDILKDTWSSPLTTEAMGPKKLDPPQLSCWEQKAAGSERDASGRRRDQSRDDDGSRMEELLGCMYFCPSI